MSEMVKIAAEEWNSMSPDEKKKYEDKSD